MGIVAALVMGAGVGGLCLAAASRWHQAVGVIGLLFGSVGTWIVLSKAGFSDAEQIAMTLAGLAVFFGIPLLP